MTKRKPTNVITKIRTATGDSGTTFLRTEGQSKGSALVDFVGNLDEAIAAMGSCDVSFDTCFEGSTTQFDYHKRIFDQFSRSIELLFSIGTMVHSDEAFIQHKDILNEYVAETSLLMETVLDDENISLEPLQGFIIPNTENGDLMLARAIVRRCERSAVVADQHWSVPVLNTMSDFIFFVVWFTSHYFEQWKGIRK